MFSNLQVVWSEWISIELVAMALALDAFSIAIGMGMRPMRLRMILYISLIIGFFHVSMPLTGIVIGKFLSLLMGEVAQWIGGGLLLYLGIQMIWHALLSDDENAWVSIRGTGIILFSLSVSIDALSAGISFGLFSHHLLFTIFAFGGTAMVFTAIGLWMGRRLGHLMGGYGDIFGGLILFFFGLRVLFG
ncbi:manganese efflux pump MntP [Rubeoparvulum massiliense]|uniref:manganese efflux pump MntP n=1 Tax=Rubeoparvulum massiliense TaxID=1631346 RepID=UPI00065E3586|nr:manganese efflux pump MntP family protein [Rubeoparvulum massiliense]